MLTFGDFKNQVRQRIFPVGEAPNVRLAHDRSFIDAIVDIQKWVECFQQDNTTLFQQCTTLFDCGLTVFNAPRGIVRSVSVIDSGVPTPDASVTQGQISSISGNISEVAASDNDGGGIFQPGDSEWMAGFLFSADNPTRLTRLINALNFDQPVTVSAYSIDFLQEDFGKRAVFALFGLNSDGVTWDKIDGERSIVLSATNTGALSISNPKPYSQFRVVMVNSGVDGYIASDSPHFFTGNASAGNGSVSESEKDDDYCSEISYQQIDPCHIRKYFSKAKQCASCGGSSSYFVNPCLFFGTDNKYRFDEPTDEGLPDGLPRLPLGLRYGQPSTDSKYRAKSGKWAIERGKLFIAPWINSTETVIVKWDGIKREWTDSDPISADPTFERAVSAFVLRDHFKYIERNAQDADAAERDYNVALQTLSHTCEEENQVRGCTTSKARGDISSQVTELFYNDEQKYTAVCPQGTAGRSITVTITAGTISSAISVSDANDKALSEARQDAQDQITCAQNSAIYYNTEQAYTAKCEAVSGAPTPDGSPIRVVIPAGTVSSSISVDDANASALRKARSEAESGLSCVWWNRAVTYIATCPNDPSIIQSVNVSARQASSTISQADADEKARITIGKPQAEAMLDCGSGAGAGVDGGGIYTNAPVTACASYMCRLVQKQVCVTITSGFTSLVSVEDATRIAQSAAEREAQARARARASSPQCLTRAISVGT